MTAARSQGHGGHARQGERRPQPKRTSSTAAALMIGVSLVAFNTILASSSYGRIVDLGVAVLDTVARPRAGRSATRFACASPATGEQRLTVAMTFRNKASSACPPTTPTSPTISTGRADRPAGHREHAGPLGLRADPGTGLLRAVGMARRQMRAMVRWESVIIALFGTGMGLAIGLFFSWALVKAGPDQATLTVPLGQLAAITLVAAMAGVVAAILPARRASRLNVLAAIAAE
jgi:FtsX-like permease family protein